MTYTPQPIFRYLVYPFFGVFVLAAVYLVVQVSRGNGPPIWFAALWIAVLVWNGYWLMWRTCVEVRVDQGTLSWRTPLTHSNSPSARITRVRKSRMSRQLAVIEIDAGDSLIVSVGYGFAALTDAIAKEAPQARIDAS